MDSAAQASATARSVRQFRSGRSILQSDTGAAKHIAVSAMDYRRLVEASSARCSGRVVGSHYFRNSRNMPTQASRSRLLQCLAKLIREPYLRRRLRGPKAGTKCAPSAIYAHSATSTLSRDPCPMRAERYCGDRFVQSHLCSAGSGKVNYERAEEVGVYVSSTSRTPRCQLILSSLLPFYCRATLHSASNGVRNKSQ